MISPTLTPNRKIDLSASENHSTRVGWQELELSRDLIKNTLKTPRLQSGDERGKEALASQYFS